MSKRSYALTDLFEKQKVLYKDECKNNIQDPLEFCPIFFCLSQKSNCLKKFLYQDNKNVYANKT